MEKSVDLLRELVVVGKKLVEQYDVLLKEHKLIRSRATDEKNFDLLKNRIENFDDSAIFLMFVLGDDFFSAHDELTMEEVAILDLSIGVSSLVKYLMGEMEEEVFRSLMSENAQFNMEKVESAISEFNKMNL